MSLRVCLFHDEYAGPLQHWRSQIRARNVASTKVDAFFAFKRDIAQRLDVVIEHVKADFDNLEREIESHEADLVLVIPDWSKWHLDPIRLVESFARIHAKPTRPALAVFDISDPTSSPFLDLLPHVDVFLKSQLLVEPGRYAEEMKGGYIFADWVHNEMPYDIGDWHLGTKGDPAYFDRLMCGWTMGISRFYRRLARYADAFSKPLRRRDFDLNRRFAKPDPATSPTWDWYHEYRRFAATQVEALTACKLTPSRALPQFEYLRDLMKCRAAFSPYGWGEICFRDYEAVACGAVLLKPDMSNLESKPDIFEAGETYVPVRWDMSDLAEKMEWLGDCPDEAGRIAHNARQRLDVNVIRDGFIDDLREILVRTGLMEPFAG